MSEETAAPSDGAPVDGAPAADEILAALLAAAPAARSEASSEDEVLRVPPEELRALAAAAEANGFEMCSDITAVDYLRKRRTRFELVVNLLSLRHNRRLRILVPIPDGGDGGPGAPSLAPIYPGANFLEREVYDMFGIRFEGHPDLTRILMPDDWEGYPLRRDYGVGAVPVQFKEAPRVT